LTLTPFFLDGPHGRLFCEHFRDANVRSKYRLIVVPPFAEELNKCRKLIALTATRLAAAGIEVIVPDLFGTGDSEGEFSDCRWDIWLEDINCASRWLCTQAPDAKPAILSVRAGSLFLPDLYRQAALDDYRVIMWQPIYDGEQLIRQFLRLRVLSNKFAGIDESVTDLLEQLRSGKSVEVAGYELSSELALSIGSTSLKTLDARSSEWLRILECRSSFSEKLSGVGEKFMEQLRVANTHVGGMVVVGEQFWATQEISAPFSVTKATVDALLA
jgi:exosortase A-associated hydrolase 2